MLLNFNLLLGFLMLLAGNTGLSNTETTNITTLNTSNSTYAAKAAFFEENIATLYNDIDLMSYNLDFEAFKLAMIGYTNLNEQNKLSDKKIITIIDFNKSSREERFYTIDLENRKVLYHSLVAHGQNTGGDMAKYFSNNEGSHQSSLGFYVTGETYTGSKGFSLRLDGMDKGYNDRMRERAVVIHAADYVNKAFAQKQGRLGRSWGCPALPNEINKNVINTIKDKTLIFAYFNDAKFLSASDHLNEQKAVEAFFEDFKA